MSMLILDPDLERRLREEREKEYPKNHDEIWDGVYVMAALANNEHQAFVVDLAFAFCMVVDRVAGDRVMHGFNVSDLDEDWKFNYRCPDVAVYLRTNPGTDCNTHWMEGPDLAVEITSPGEDPREKLAFYAKVNTREVLIVDRNPWKIELYQLRGGKMAFAGMSDATNPAVLPSVALPLTFQLEPGSPRPIIRIAHTASNQTWTA
ncbi:MAG: Uma2 family endonuclease [Gemmataceae bacterium]